MVTGAVALMLSANRSLTVGQIKQRLINGADDSAALNNRSVSDGELNVNNALLRRAGVQIASTPALALTRVAVENGLTLSPNRLFSDRLIA